MPNYTSMPAKRAKELTRKALAKIDMEYANNVLGNTFKKIGQAAESGESYINIEISPTANKVTKNYILLELISAGYKLPDRESNVYYINWSEE